MNTANDRFALRIDWLIVLIYALLVLMGWLNIYAVVYDAQVEQNIFDLSLNSGKQLLWISLSALLIIVVMALDYKFYDSFAYIIYALVIVALVGVMVAGAEIAGSRSWFKIGPFSIQPAEFSKLATALALARYASQPGVKLSQTRHQLLAAAIVLLPPLIIILQNETGTALVFSAFVVAFYREGLPTFIPLTGLVAVAIFVLTLLVPDLYWLMGGLALVAGGLLFFIPRNLRNIGLVTVGLTMMLGLVLGVDYFVNDVLQPHQQNRIKALINPDADPLGFGWNVTQSKIAIGSGGLWGKGFLQGTQTKFDFVPEQSTDFIFCTIGEEHGWLGALVLISLYVALLYRISVVAERQRSRFARVYGYGVLGIFLFHFTINIGMTIGLFPVIGIPLPFFSYGGSSLWSFTLLLFILLKLDAHRTQVLRWGND